MLTTKRLTLRRAQMNDAPALHRVFSDPRAMRYWDCLPYTDLAQTEQLLDWMVTATDSDDFVVVKDATPIGKAGCWKVGEVGFILHPDHWGQGLAFEALQATLPHAFATLPMDRVEADVDPRNTASLTLLGKLGFTETGRAERTIKVGDDWCDSVYLALTRAVFEAKTHLFTPS